MTPKHPVDIDAAFEDGTLIDEAMNEAVKDAIEEHRKAGRPLVVFRDGKVAYVMADDIESDAADIATGERDP